MNIKKYDVEGRFISPIRFEESDFKRYAISITKASSVFVYTDDTLIDFASILTMYDHIQLFDEYGLETVLFQKHIVKITNVTEEK